jgi:2-methylcitrate dehydratase PrpD
MQTAVRRIAAFASDLTLADIPEPVRRVARTCVVDTLGVAIAGSRKPAVQRLHALARETYARGPATLLGSSDRLTAPGAALVNGAAAHALDFDDNCYAGFVHGSAVIIPAALAVAETARVGGADLVLALVAGYEAEFAAGAAATQRLYEKGWWTTGVLGPIGAAVAAAKIIGGGAQLLADALGLAVAGAGGA